MSSIENNDSEEQEEKKARDRKFIKKIKGNYVRMEASIVQQLKLAHEHPSTIGGFREEVWRSLFEQIIPKKFSIERSVFIIDSHGQVSNEIDLAIYDEQYTPYIFNYGKMKFIPIEAVAAVIECKSLNVDEKVVLNWAKNVESLKTSLKSIVRTQSFIATGELNLKPEEDSSADKKQCESVKQTTRTTQTSTRPLKILCYTSEVDPKEKISECFDFMIHPRGRQLIVHLSSVRKSLDDWHRHLNYANPEYKKLEIEKFPKALEKTLDSYKIVQKESSQDEIALLSLTFQLNQLLMLINNPIWFPHQAYVDMFNVADVDSETN